MPWQELVDDIADGTLKIKIGKVFGIDEIVQAHRCMEANEAEDKIVIQV